jgi:ABC-type sugar transport system permease subunit
LFNSKVGALDNAHGGKTVWQTTLNYPVSRLLALPATDEVLAGDQQGNVTLLDNRGTTRDAVQLSQYPIRALAVDPTTGDYVAGDSNGALFALNRQRKLILTRNVADSIAAVLPAGAGQLLVVPGDGPWQELNAEAIGGQGQAAQVQQLWLEVDVVLLIAILLTSVLAVRRLSALVVAAWHARLAYALVLPAIVLLGVLIYYPAALAIYYSLTNFSLGNVTEFVGLANFQQIFTEDFYFRTGMVNMLLIALTSVIKAVTVPLLVAELIFWLRNRVHQYVFRTLFVLPAVVPALVFALLWKQVYDPRTGLLNELLAVLGQSQWQQAWLGNAHTALWAIIGVGFPYVDAFAFLILLGGLLNINAEFFDAAKVDGAGWWSRFRHIDLPLLVAQFRVLLFFAVNGTVQGFAGIFILTQGGPGTATYVPALQMYLRISDGDFGYASAIGVILFAIIFVATIFILRFRRQAAIEVA